MLNFNCNFTRKTRFHKIEANLGNFMDILSIFVRKLQE